MARKNTLEQKRDRRLQKQLTAYSVAAGATLALASPADAALVSNWLQQPIPFDSTTAPIDRNIDLNGDTIDDFELFVQAGPSSNDTWVGIRGLQVTTPYVLSGQVRVAGHGPLWTQSPGPGVLVKNIPYSNYIPPWYTQYWQPQGTLNGIKGTFQGYPLGFGLFDSSQGFIGVRISLLDPNDPNNSNWHLGWIAYQGDNNSPSGTILGWAYDNDHTSTQMHANPIPGTFGLGLLALGAAGVARLRQRKKEAKEETA